MADNKRNYQRKKYLINKKLQMRYVRLVVAPTICVAAVVYYLVYYLLIRHIAIPEIIVNNILAPFKEANIILLILMPIILLPLVIGAIFMSHKIAGPMYRIEMELERILNGDLSKRIILRKGDYMKEIADGINLLIDKLAKKR